MITFGSIIAQCSLYVTHVEVCLVVQRSDDLTRTIHTFLYGYYTLFAGCIYVSVSLLLFLTLTLTIVVFPTLLKPLDFEPILLEQEFRELLSSEIADDILTTDSPRSVAQSTTTNTKQCSLAHRKQFLDRYCAKHHPERRKAFIGGGFQGSWLSKRLLVDDMHRLILCPIPKIGVSTWRSYLMRATGHEDRLWTEENRGTKMLSEYSPEEAEYRLQNYLKVIVARHPLDRLLSAFNDKFVESQYRVFLRPFIVDHCRRGIKHIPKDDYRTYFRRNSHPEDPILKEHVDHYREYLATKNKQNPYRINFTEFLLYVSTTNKGTRNPHWRSIELMCQPCDVSYDVILKMETMDRDSQYIIDKMASVHAVYGHTKLSDLHSLRDTKQTKWNISPTRGYVQNLLMKNRSFPRYNATHKPLILRELSDYFQMPDNLIQDIIKIYQNDMVMFGYDFNTQKMQAECSYEESGLTCC